MKRVIVGLSGGVDSSVAAYILKEKGYEVVGVTYKMLEDFDTSDAEKIAKELDIEFHIEDITKQFKEEIIDYFIREYQEGLTPNPCVICNKQIKFKYLSSSLKKYNADLISTGHYVKVEKNKLYKGEDENKDQSYFLYNLNKDIISKLIFPLENLNKTEVREIAKKQNLITANKKDSFDVCFIKETFKSFVKNNMENKEGKIINIETKKEIGTHNGLSYYTIGQRKGLNIGGSENKLFVVGKSIKDNILYVGETSNNEYLYSDSCIIENINFINDERPAKCCAKFRYRQKEIPVSLEYIEDKILVKYDKTKSITPGQSCVFYIDNMCIGGGVIKEVRKNNEKLWYLL